MRNLVGAIIRSNKVFQLIKNHDRICVGVSGGKDSTLLFYALKLYSQYLKRKYHWNIEVFGVHINMNYYKNTKYESYLKWLKKYQLEIKIIDSNIGDVLKAKTRKNRIQCSLCAKLKKAILTKYAKKMGCNKIATGHHADDAIETMFMNMISEGRIATISPIVDFDRNKILLIRPFILSRESEIINVANKLQIPLIKNVCPNETNTRRSYIKEFLNSNFYKNPLFPNCQTNFITALLNGKQANLWFTNHINNKDLLKIVNETKTLKLDD